MAREYNSWDMEAGTRARMAEGYKSSAYGDLPPGSDVNAIVDRVGKQELIQRLAGTTDKKDRAYKSARDKVTRWEKGTRNPNKDAQSRMSAIMEDKRRQEMRNAGRVNVKVKGEYRFSSGTWDYVEAPLTGPALEDFMSAMERGDYEMATQIVAEEYGVDPGDIEGMEGFEGVDMDW